MFLNHQTFEVIKRMIKFENKKRRKIKNDIMDKFYQDNKSKIKWEEVIHKYSKNTTISRYFFNEEEEEDDEEEEEDEEEENEKMMKKKKKMKDFNIGNFLIFLQNY